MTEQPPIPEIDKAARIVMLTYGRTEDGTQPYWCYIAVKPSEYDRFMEVLKAGSLNPKNCEKDGFGEIAATGIGQYPPVEITREVAEAYGVTLKEMFPGEPPKEALSKKIKRVSKKKPNAE